MDLLRRERTLPTLTFIAVLVVVQTLFWLVVGDPLLPNPLFLVSLTLLVLVAFASLAGLVVGAIEQLRDDLERAEARGVLAILRDQATARPPRQRRLHSVR